MLITLASMHGIFEAAGSLSILKNMGEPVVISSSIEGGLADECCDEEAIELSTVAFHCPVDGKILTSGSELNSRVDKQIHFACDGSITVSISSNTLFRPPIV